MRRIAILNDQKEIEKIIGAKSMPYHYDLYLKRARDRHLFFEIKIAISISKIYTKAARELGLPGTWHSLRHSAATYMLESGVPLETVQLILGHENIKMSRYYAKVTMAKKANDMKNRVSQNAILYR